MRERSTTVRRHQAAAFATVLALADPAEQVSQINALSQQIVPGKDESSDAKIGAGFVLKDLCTSQNVQYNLGEAMALVFINQYDADDEVS